MLKRPFAINMRSENLLNPIPIFFADQRFVNPVIFYSVIPNDTFVVRIIK